MPPSYRERLRIEGGTLAGAGLLDAVILALVAPGAAANRTSTMAQLAAVALLLVLGGPPLIRRALRRAQDRTATSAGSGEPTPAWHVVAVCAGLTLAFGIVAGWDAGMRIAGGCVLVGLAQALLLERLVAGRERGEGAVFVRLPGSRIGRGSRLGRVQTP